MSGSGKSKEKDNVHYFPYYDLEAAIEVLGAFITSGIRDEVEALRQEVAAIKAQGRGAEAPGAGPEKDRYLNQREAAEFLGCSTSHIRRQRQKGSFPEPVKLSDRDLRWPRSALSRWAEQRVGESVEESRR